jgi:hypothetical protein
MTEKAIYLAIYIIIEHDIQMGRIAYVTSQRAFFQKEEAWQE